MSQILKKEGNLSFSSPSKSAVADWLNPGFKDKLRTREFSRSWPHLLGEWGDKEGRIVLLLFLLGRQEEESTTKWLLLFPPTASLPGCLIPYGFGEGCHILVLWGFLKLWGICKHFGTWLFSAAVECLHGEDRGSQRRWAAPSEAEAWGALIGSRLVGVVQEGGCTLILALRDAAGDGWMTYSTFILLSQSGKQGSLHQTTQGFQHVWLCGPLPKGNVDCADCVSLAS